jgi:hypothetical protein
MDLLELLHDGQQAHLAASDHFFVQMQGHRATMSLGLVTRGHRVVPVGYQQGVELLVVPLLLNLQQGVRSRPSLRAQMYTVKGALLHGERSSASSR